MLHGTSASGADRRRTWNTSISGRNGLCGKFFSPEKKGEARQELYLQDLELRQHINLSQMGLSFSQVRLDMISRAMQVPT